TGVMTFTSRAATNPVQAVAFSPQGDTLASSSHGVVRLWDATTGKLLAGPGGTTENFLRIGHSLFTLVLAFVGGHLSRYLYGRGRGGDSHSPSDSPTPTCDCLWTVGCLVTQAHSTRRESSLVHTRRVSSSGMGKAQAALRTRPGRWEPLISQGGGSLA